MTALSLSPYLGVNRKGLTIGLPTVDTLFDGPNKHRRRGAARGEHRSSCDDKGARVAHLQFEGFSAVHSLGGWVSRVMLHDTRVGLRKSGGSSVARRSS